MAGDEDMDLTAGYGEEGSSTQNDVETPPKTSGKGLKGFATKKGPKLARARKKNPITLSNKATKPSAGKKI